MKRRVIVVTGTPGTGKTTFSKILAKSMKANLVDLNRLIVEKGIYRKDKEGTRVVHLEKMKREFEKIARSSREDLVAEGILSHFLPKKSVTHVVVLRTRPKVLARRLGPRKYGEKKIGENLESEALDIILWEAVKIHGAKKVYEIDTTGESPKSSAGIFLKALDKKKRLAPGKISWLEEYFISSAQ